MCNISLTTTCSSYYQLTQVLIGSSFQVACYMKHVVDGGRTLLGAAARRHADYRGHNLCKALIHYAFVDTLSQRPTIQRMRGWSPHYKYWAESGEKKTDEGFRILVRKVWYAVCPVSCVCPYSSSTCVVFRNYLYKGQRGKVNLFRAVPHFAGYDHHRLLRVT